MRSSGGEREPLDRPRRRWLVASLAALLLIGACGTDQGGPSPAPHTTATPTTATVVASTPDTITTVIRPPSTTAVGTTPTTASPSTSTTTESTSQPTSSTSLPTITGPLRFLRYGDFGLWLHDSKSATELFAEPVWWAADDHLGGVVFRQFLEPDTFWLRAASATPERLPFNSSTVALLDGRPTLIAVDQMAEQCDGADYLTLLIDLADGTTNGLGCLSGEDGGLRLEGGGDLLVGTRSIAVGSNSTSFDIQFLTLTGQVLAHPHNPFPDSCAPCELAAIPSPDGTLLAVQHRPDAKWSDDLDEQARLDWLTWDEWWATSSQIPSDLTILDLESGAVLFSGEFPADQGGLTSFDGRYAVLEARAWSEATQRFVTRSTVIDTTGASGPYEFSAAIALVHETIGDR